MSDKILINDLRIETIIGLYPWEKCVKQTLLIDLILHTDIRKAAADDDLHHTINYEAVCQHVLNLAEAKQFKLIETFAETIATLLLQEFTPNRVSVTIKKCDNMTEVNHVGVCIERP